MKNARKTKTVNWGLKKGIWSQVMPFQHMYMNFRRMSKKMYSFKSLRVYYKFVHMLDCFRLLLPNECLDRFTFISSLMYQRIVSMNKELLSLLHQI